MTRVDGGGEGGGVGEVGGQEASKGTGGLASCVVGVEGGCGSDCNRRIPDYPLHPCILFYSMARVLESF